MLSTSPRHVTPVVMQHVEEAAVLRSTRTTLVKAPHVKLHHLRRLDNRLIAHLDGIAVAGEYGAHLGEAALASPGAGEVFVSAVGAIESNHISHLHKLFSLAEAIPEAQPGLLSAFGWVSAQHLQGITKELLASANPLRRMVGIAACAMHRLDPGRALDAALSDPDPALRARALRAAGQLGRRDLLAASVNLLSDEDARCRFRAAWSAVLLGERASAVEALVASIHAPGPFRDRALQLTLKLLDGAAAHALLKQLARDQKEIRALIRGSGISGNPAFVPWLIKQMGDDKLARIAGESFSLITGTDLAWLDLERKPPENFESGPNDDPNDDDVGMDEDDGLPWPDSARVQAWWDGNSHLFDSKVRYFMGAAVTMEHCITVLEEGYQRQRIAAAEYLCLLHPGTILFNTAAPAWRQQRWLAKMA